MSDVSGNNVMCVWAGSFASEEMYHRYMEMHYEDDDAFSRFGIDAGLPWYDEDFLESWWIEGFSEEKLELYVRGVLDSQVFYDELKDVIAKQSANVLLFMFGEHGKYPINEQLFDYDGRGGRSETVKLVFKKIYDRA